MSTDSGSQSIPTNALTLMAVLAHPDDESMGFGGTLAKYSAEGVKTAIVTATRGERGRFGDAVEKPSPDVIGRTREAELRAAATLLGVPDVTLLGYPDGGLDGVPAPDAVARIAHEIRRVRPHVVITFAPDGAYGHPDHIAICQFTTAAVVAAAGAPDADFAAHHVAKLYYLAWGRERWETFEFALRKLTSKVDGVDRQASPWPDWQITTRIDTADVWSTVWRAVACHETQISIYKNLAHLPDEQHRALWGSQEFYRAFSLVNGGRARETDLFEGLR